MQNLHLLTIRIVRRSLGGNYAEVLPNVKPCNCGCLWTIPFAYNTYMMRTDGKRMRRIDATADEKVDCEVCGRRRFGGEFEIKEKENRK